MKVLMIPNVGHFRSDESGIKRVVEAYYRHLPQFGVEFAGSEDNDYDLKAVHAGTSNECDVFHSHGMYWSADYHAWDWEYKGNASVINLARQAKLVTVPSRWVAETFQRDMRFTPHVIGHGIEWHEWQHNLQPRSYVLWNKNRNADVCDPQAMCDLAGMMPKAQFYSTFICLPKPANVREIGLLPHGQMKAMVQQAAIYLSTTKETFGIGILEALAAGTPVLGYAQGGILDIVKHGVNGYLAQPGNLEDLADGLDYCMKHRKVLGDNGREAAKEFTWHRVCEKVAQVYKEVLIEEPPSVAIIIPSYKYGNIVGRAIESAVKQTYHLLKDIIVVDDGSNDDGLTEKVVNEWHGKDSRVRYVSQSNGGVATARNNGIVHSIAKYICCLDADDALEPTFLERLVLPLEEDNGLGITYSGLQWIKPDGSTGVSAWPGDFDYEAQLRRRNQVPTACVFRREMWKRLGGYRQRYAPGGAGTEDAEFWLRAGSIGYDARKATSEPLFIYSWQSGRVSGDPKYKEADWLAWSPWTKDFQHPFASLAKPKHISHPVRQYDEPLISVIIPVADYHHKDLIDAMDSVEAQTLRKWELIVCWDDANSEPPKWMSDAYPFVRFVNTNGKGAGHARNRGAELARAPLLLFLDADDQLYPEFMDRTFREFEHGEAIVYTAYHGNAFIEDVSKLATDLQPRILFRDEKTFETIIAYRSQEYDCQRAQRQPESDDPTYNYHWCLMTALTPKVWHNQIDGFDEELESWEDVDYWWRMAKAGKCFIRLKDELMLYRFASGRRRDAALPKAYGIIKYLNEKYKELEIMPCSGCGRRATNAEPPPMPQGMMAAITGKKASEEMKDDEMVMIFYDHPNRGSHPVVGPVTKTKYGYRGGGERFLIARVDQVAMPHYFKIIEERPPAQERPVAPPPPEPMANMALPEESLPFADEPIVSEMKPKDDSLQLLPGITPETERLLAKRGVKTMEELLAFGEDELAALRGVGKTRAKVVFELLEKMRQQ